MILNMISILLTASGTVIMYFFTPKTDRQVYAYNKSEIPLRKKQDKKKNLRLKQGFYLILLGILFQIFAFLK